MKRNKLDRFIEIAEPIVVYSFIAFIFVGSVFIPIVVAYVLLAFSVYWLFMSLKFITFLVLSLAKVRESKTVNWMLRNHALINPEEVIGQLTEDLYELENDSSKPQYRKLISYVKYKLGKNYAKRFLKNEIKYLRRVTSKQYKYNYLDLIHVFIMAEYKEPVGTIIRTMKTVIDNDFPMNKVYFVVGQEERDKTVPERRAQLEIEAKKLGFAGVWFTSHPADTPGEIIGKASNENFAARFVSDKATEMGWDPEKVILHTHDADNNYGKKYLSQLSFKYCINDYPTRRIYHAGIVYYNNIDKIPIPNKIVNALNSMWNIQLLSAGYKLIPVSSYGLSLDMARDVGFWDPDVMPEDHHMFYKCFFKYGDVVQTIPIFSLGSVDAAEDVTVRKTVYNQYKQFQRWAYGVSDITYIVRQMFVSKVNLFSRVDRTFHFLQTHFLWSTTWFVITLGSSIPVYLNPRFKETVLGENLQVLTSSMFTVTFLAFLFAIISDIFLRPKSGSKFDTTVIRFFRTVEWLTLPVVTFFYSTLPGLDAHTRLLFGKYLEYHTTVKVDPNKPEAVIERPSEVQKPV